jgi:hypothetical protein
VLGRFGLFLFALACLFGGMSRIDNHRRGIGTALCAVGPIVMLLAWNLL